MFLEAPNSPFNNTVNTSFNFYSTDLQNSNN